MAEEFFALVFCRGKTTSSMRLGVDSRESARSRTKSLARRRAKLARTPEGTRASSERSEPVPCGKRCQRCSTLKEKRVSKRRTQSAELTLTKTAHTLHFHMILHLLLLRVWSPTPPPPPFLLLLTRRLQRVNLPRRLDRNGKTGIRNRWIIRDFTHNVHSSVCSGSHDTALQHIQPNPPQPRVDSPVDSAENLGTSVLFSSDLRRSNTKAEARAVLLYEVQQAREPHPRACMLRPSSRGTWCITASALSSRQHSSHDSDNDHDHSSTQLCEHRA